MLTNSIFKEPSDYDQLIYTVKDSMQKKILIINICILVSLSAQLLCKTPKNINGIYSSISEQKWQDYIERTTTEKTWKEKISEFFFELKQHIVHHKYLNALFFKNNRIETPFVQKLLMKFDLDPEKVAVVQRKGPVSGTLFNCVMFNPDKIKKYTPEEQEWLIGQELIHLKHMDWFKSLALSYLLFKILTKYVLSSIPDKYKLLSYNIRLNEDYSYKYIYPIAKKVLGACLTYPLYCSIARLNEKRADLESASILRCPRAAITALKKMHKSYIKKKHFSFNPNGLFYKLFFNLYDKQPVYEERIRYLTELAQKLEQQEVLSE